MIGSHLYFELPSGTTLNAFGSYTLHIYNSDNTPFITTVQRGSDAVKIMSTTLTSIVLNITKANADVEISIKNSFNDSDTIKFNTGTLTTYFNLKDINTGQDVYIDRTSGYFTINYDILGLKDSDIVISAPQLTKISERTRFVIDTGEDIIKTLVVETNRPFATTLTAFDDEAGHGSTVILNSEDIPVDEILQRFVNNGAVYGSIFFMKPYDPSAPAVTSIYTNATDETSYIGSTINRDSKTITIQYSRNELPREKRTPITISLGSFHYSFVLVQPASPTAVYFNYDDSYLPPVLGESAEKTIDFNTNIGNTVTITSFNYNPAMLRTYYTGTHDLLQEPHVGYVTYSLYFRYWVARGTLAPNPNYDFEQPVQFGVEVTTQSGTVYNYNVDLTISQANKAYVVNDNIFVDKNNNISGSFEIKPNLVTDIVASPTVTWLSANSFVWNPDNNSVEILSIAKNTSTTSRTTTVPITFNRGTYSPMQATLHITQEAGVASFCKKAFEDIYIESPEADSIEVYTDYGTLYEGTIVAKVNLNEFAPQMFIDKPRIFDNSFIDLNLTKWIYAETSNLAAEHVVTYDYSYDIASHLNITEVAQPIDYYDPRQLVFESIFNYDTGFNTMKVNNRSYVNLEPYHKYNMTLSGTEPTITFTYKIDTASYSGKTFKQKCTNANYAVYYMNAYGGWNWMLFEGNKQVKRYNNTFSSVVGLTGVNEVYKVETQTNYDLTSLFLTDEGAKNLAHLYKSQIVYLHDFDTDSIIEVKVATNTYAEKTYINQGRKYFTQSITLTEVKNKMIY